ncbi:ATP-binding protein [Spirosoma pulveris]
MVRSLRLLGMLLGSQLVLAQQRLPSARIVAVQAGNNQKDSSFVHVYPSTKDPVRLRYDQNYLIFSFIDPKHPAVKTFHYKLTGLDYSWMTCTDCTQALYAHLDGGDYTFQVKTTEDNALPARFSFTIEGNSWHKWWFVPMLFLYVLGVLGVGIYFFVLYRFRQKLLEQRHIHKEKMAAMAELTAGIAHEIQNPLNFVNNFAEVSVEMMEELKEEAQAGRPAGVLTLADELKENLQRITENGQRASNIVRGMLEHSRISTGERQPTNLNSLVGESLHRAYLGIKQAGGLATSFTCQLETHFDANLPLISVAAQDISRVLINLYNNAFYSIQQRLAGLSAQTLKNGLAYVPTVRVTTVLLLNRVEVRVQDNGMGIPEAIQGKIFQPFFTTKPAGEGTGLGLSLSYDIITRGHGGTLTVRSVEGEGSEFVITLPVH